jgi:hypothetical protein
LLWQLLGFSAETLQLNQLKTLGQPVLEELIGTLIDIKREACSYTECKKMHTDIVALLVGSRVIGDWSGGESFIFCVGGLEVSRLSSVLVVWR